MEIKYMRSQLKYINFLIWAYLLWMSGCNNDESNTIQSLRKQDIDALDLNITISLVKGKDHKPRLKITESFVMPSDSLYLRLPENFMRNTNLYDRIEGLEASSSAKLYHHEKYPYIKRIDFLKNERVTLTYLYKPDKLRANTDDKEVFSAPIIRDDYFQFIGVMMFIIPVGLENIKTDIPIKLNFDLPHNFSAFSSFADSKEQNIVASIAKIRDALFIGGSNIRAYQVDILGHPVHITMQGVWPNIDDNEFIDVTSKLLKEQRKTWNDNNYPRFLVHYSAKNNAPCLKIKGTAHTDAFRAIFPDSCQFKADLRQLISHELMHMWIGKKIKIGESPRGRIDGKWFSEGFTDYYGRILAYRAFVLSEDQYFITLNTQIEKYYRSKERNRNLAYVIENMYSKNSNHELEQLPYQQGEIMAIILNKAIKENSRYSLDNVIKDMIDLAETQDDNLLSVAQIESIINKYVPNIFAKEYNKIVNGDLLILPDLPTCRAAQNYIDTTTLLPGLRYSSPSLGNCNQWLWSNPISI